MWCRQDGFRGLVRQKTCESHRFTVTITVSRAGIDWARVSVRIRVSLVSVI